MAIMYYCLKILISQTKRVLNTIVKYYGININIHGLLIGCKMTAYNYNKKLLNT